MIDDIVIDDIVLNDMRLTIVCCLYSVRISRMYTEALPNRIDYPSGQSEHVQDLSNLRFQSLHLTPYTP